MDVRRILEEFKQDRRSLDSVMAALKRQPYEQIDCAKIDHHRAVRSGFPEVVFCEGKQLDHIVQIFKALEKQSRPVLLTRAAPEVFEALHPLDTELVYHQAARIIARADRAAEPVGRLTVICAGTADIPVAEEAAVTAETCGSRVERLFDVGVAGLHRLLDQLEPIQQANSIVCIAGMEGALPSVVGGLAGCPVVAVPTSVGYGTHLNGLVPLFSMLNSCASNVTVVNIDNGFGAGYIAAMINRQSAAPAS
jgi:NCAIR mutase (PurE)-related protein